MDAGAWYDRHRRGERRAEEWRGFDAHLTVYLVMNFGLALIDVLSGGGWWFFWPLIAWGIGLVIHGTSVFLENRPRVRTTAEPKIGTFISKEIGSGRA